MSVYCECYLLSGRGLCDELTAGPGESPRVWCGVVWCDRDASIMRKLWPIGGCCAVRKIIKISDTFDYPTFLRPRIVKIIGIHVHTKRNKWLVNSYDAQRRR